MFFFSNITNNNWEWLLLTFSLHAHSPIPTKAMPSSCKTPQSCQITGKLCWCKLTRCQSVTKHRYVSSEAAQTPRPSLSHTVFYFCLSKIPSWHANTHNTVNTCGTVGLFPHRIVTSQRHITPEAAARRWNVSLCALVFLAFTSKNIINFPKRTFFLFVISGCIMNSLTAESVECLQPRTLLSTAGFF